MLSSMRVLLFFKIMDSRLKFNQKDIYNVLPTAFL